MVTQLTLSEAWELLESDPEARMIDVRTEAEWNFVGIPARHVLGTRLRLVQWITFPGGAPNPDFVAQASAGLQSDQPVLFLCRSGARSQSAAEAFEANGFSRTFNISAGFEGDKGPDGHRRGGWKHEGLPWEQG